MRSGRGQSPERGAKSGWLGQTGPALPGPVCPVPWLLRRPHLQWLEPAISYAQLACRSGADALTTGTSALKKRFTVFIGESRGGWNTKIRRVAADDRTAIAFALSPGPSS